MTNPIGVYGLNEWTGALAAHTIALDAAVGVVTARTVQQAVADCIPRTPVDTGALVGSIAASPDTSRTPWGWHGEYGSHLHYAPYQEYGTEGRGLAAAVGRVLAPGGSNAPSGGGVPPKFMFRDSFAMNAPRYEAALAALAVV